MNQEQADASPSSPSLILHEPRWWTPFALLFGSRTAIYQVFACSNLHWLACALLLLAAVSRNYDGASFLHEPSLLAHGLLVSLGNSTVLFLLGLLAVRKRGVQSIVQSWWKFVLLFWMTSPMAWLYAVPYEQFLPPMSAVAANGITLGIISIWRVAFMTRLMQVLFKLHATQSLCIVLGFSAITTFIGTQLMNQPLVDFMGGMRFTEVERAVSQRHAATVIYSLFASPILGLAALLAIAYSKGEWQTPPPLTSPTRVPRSWWLVPSVIACILFVGSVWMQPKHFRRAQAEALLQTEQVSQALTYLSSFSENQLPKHWQPPPRRLYRETLPTSSDVRAALQSTTASPWVRALFLKHIWQRDVMDAIYFADWSHIATPKDVIETATRIDNESSAHGIFASEGRSSLDTAVRWHLAHDETWTDTDREAAKRWLAK